MQLYCCTPVSLPFCVFAVISPLLWRVCVLDNLQRDRERVISSYFPCLLRQVRTRWDEDNTLLTSSAKGRGVANGGDRRQILDKEQRARLCKYITEQQENGKQVGRRTVAEWMKTQTGRDMSDLSAGRLLSRLGYRRRNGSYCS